MSDLTLALPDGEYPPPVSCIVTVRQLEERHPGLKDRVRGFILRSDLNDPNLDGVRDAVIRIGRSVYIDEPKFLRAIASNAGKPPARPRNPDGRAGKKNKPKRGRVGCAA